MLSHVNQDHYTRKLTAEDEDQFIQLLTAIYGETYSYHILYETGGFSSLINQGYLTSYGEFDCHHRLLSHTGFWRKDKNSDYIESGCSFRLAAGSVEFKASREQLAWEECFAELAREYAFIHQQCSTLHCLAQRYASQFMHASPCGVLVNYAQDEKVRGIGERQKTMHALMMTSVLQPQAMSEKTVYITEDFTSWLSYIYEKLKLPRKIVSVNAIADSQLSFDLITIEDNPYVSLQRRLVVPGKDKNTSLTITPSAMRSDVIHLPIESLALMNAALPVLQRAGYMPCGLRPHVSQPDELVLQHFAGCSQTIGNLFNEMKIGDKNTKLWIEQWQKIILQIM
jgi:hypothetical protein